MSSAQMENGWQNKKLTMRKVCSAGIGPVLMQSFAAAKMHISFACIHRGCLLFCLALPQTILPFVITLEENQSFQSFFILFPLQSRLSLCPSLCLQLTPGDYVAAKVLLVCQDHVRMLRLSDWLCKKKEEEEERHAVIVSVPITVLSLRITSRLWCGLAAPDKFYKRNTRFLCVFALSLLQVESREAWFVRVLSPHSVQESNATVAPHQPQNSSLSFFLFCSGSHDPCHVQVDLWMVRLRGLAIHKSVGLLPCVCFVFFSFFPLEHSL